MDNSKFTKGLGVYEKHISFIFFFLLAKYFEQTIGKSCCSSWAIKEILSTIIDNIKKFWIFFESLFAHLVVDLNRYSFF